MAAVARSSPALVSVVVPVLGQSRLLDEQLEALAAQTYGGAWEVLVVDNGATDGLSSSLRPWDLRLPAFRVLHARPRGANVARNAGAAAARGELLAFCDADDRAAPGWLDALVRGAETADVVGSAMDESRLNEPRVRAWRAPMAVDDDGLLTWLDHRPFVLTAGLGVWTEVFWALGGFPASYRGGYDDVSFSWRAHRRGYTLACAPEAVMHYRHRRSVAGLARQYLAYGFMEPQLFREFREDGMPRRTALDAAHQWAALARRSRTALRSEPDRARWMAEAGYLSGRLAGCLRYRVAYP